MPTKWLDRTQPQTLMIATMLLYLIAVLGLISGSFLAVFPLGLIIIAAQVAGGLGIANDRKAGYWLAVGIAVLSLALVLINFRAVSFITLIFQVGLVALLLHPQSRSYKRTWFH